MRDQRFQSPLHRGRVFNQLDRCAEENAPRSFSPLFIGEGSSTGGEAGKQRSQHGFQSPLHRGRVFNVFFIEVTELQFFILSVPSSSGKGLQPGCRLLDSACNLRLSVPSSSGKGLQPHSRLLLSSLRFLLSVPSSSGKGLQQHGQQIGAALVHRTFSPLFIGEGSSTSPAAFLSAVSALIFQSPLHRGRVFNRRRH